MFKSLKSRLLKSGPDSRALRLAFRVQAAAHGILMRTSGDRIRLIRGKRELVLGTRDLILLPFAIHLWDRHFATLEGSMNEGRVTLDFSKPALHRYRKTGLSFHFPSFAEDDCMDAYLAAYSPKPGDVVWDVGAHAGTTTYFLSKMVGPRGRVYSFEPDETSHAFLLRNIEMHQLSNVVPVKAALSGTTGTAVFCMDGTMHAGLSHAVEYTVSKRNVTVETLCLPDACDRLGRVPDYIKMDIEGAEVEVISHSQNFLMENRIHFAIESGHVVDGALTSGPLDALLGDAGYRAWSSDEFGQRFTWATPAVAEGSGPPAAPVS